MFIGSLESARQTLVWRLYSPNVTENSSGKKRFDAKRVTMRANGLVCIRTPLPPELPDIFRSGNRFDCALKMAVQLINPGLRMRHRYQDLPLSPDPGCVYFQSVISVLQHARRQFAIVVE